jgi:hypothetical protein
MPALIGGFGNYFLPIHIGAPDMANKNGKFLKSPKFNSLVRGGAASRPGLLALALTRASSPLANKIFYYSTYTKNTLHTDSTLGYYLAGLIEGDGYISITNKNRVILGITFNIKDKPLAEKLLKYLGKGTIVKRKTNSIELRFSAVKTLQKIIILINGKFRTPKIDQFYKLIN